VERGILSQIAAAIGRSAEARHWKEKAASLAALARAAFPMQDGFLYDLLEGKPVPVRTPFSLLGAYFLPVREGRRLLRRWLVQTPCFEDGFLLSTVAQDEPSYLPVRWRGAAWLNVNYMVAELACRLGLREVADHIAERSIEMVGSSPGVWEHYDVASGRPGGPATFGWTAAMFIEFALKRHRDVATSLARPY
jgi:glycogen debranching enzyme